MKLSTVGAFKNIGSSGTVVLDDEQLRDLQKTLNEILADIVAVCDDKGLTYTLGGGTCLGAVRHHGFIPWDDDIDINIPRADFQAFKDAFRERFGDKYYLHAPGDTKGYNLLLSRVRKKGTSLVTREDFNNPEAGAFIDIFVIENTFDNKLLRAIHGIGCYFFGFAVSCRKFYRDRKGYMMVADRAGDRALSRVFRFKIAVGCLLSLISMDGWVRAGDRWNRLCRNDRSALVTVPTGRKFFWGEMYNREDICDTVTELYDGHDYKVPASTDKYLRNLYGDYMRIPGADEIEKHVFFEPFDLGH
ncbi:LicD family protein [Butyrivibrio sp. MC2013]|uniref:LicD family protein n=1 Tax=Butyrivibrio sp. MC2013 TaxID=1280686 RepID=UPI00041E7A30|nr:LicD family protein [Butyrivibrio sp. MC2013]